MSSLGRSLGSRCALGGCCSLDLRLTAGLSHLRPWTLPLRVTAPGHCQWHAAIYHTCEIDAIIHRIPYRNHVRPSVRRLLSEVCRLVRHRTSGTCLNTRNKLTGPACLVLASFAMVPPQPLVTARVRKRSDMRCQTDVIPVSVAAAATDGLWGRRMTVRHRVHVPLNCHRS